MHKKKKGSDDVTDLVCFELVKEMEGESCVCMQRLLSLSSGGLSADCWNPHKQDASVNHHSSYRLYLQP